MIGKSIDDADESIISDSQQAVKKNKPPRARGAGFALFIASIALFFTAVGIAAGYKHWQRMHDRAKDNARKIAVLEAALPAKTDNGMLEQLSADMQRRMTDYQTEAAQQLQQMRQMQMQTGQFSRTVTSQVEQVTALQTQLQRQSGNGPDQTWQLAEVSYLLQLASRDFQLLGSLETAEAALRAADQRLSEIGTVSYLPVREQIARDLATLEAMPSVDVAALSEQIDTLSQRLSVHIKQRYPGAAGQFELVKNDSAATATVSNTDPTAEIEAGGTESTRSKSVLGGYRQKALDALSQAIVVRKTDQPLASTLDAESQQQIYNLIQLRLENLRLMALQKNNRAYHAQIALLRTTLDEHCSTDQIAGFQMALDELAEVDLQPERPDISGSLRQLKRSRHASLLGMKQ